MLPGDVLLNVNSVFMIVCVYIECTSFEIEKEIFPSESTLFFIQLDTDFFNPFNVAYFL